MLDIWLVLGSFLVIIGLLILINAKVNGGFKLETSWVAVAFVPGILYLLGKGQLAEFSGFGLAFKLKQVSAQQLSLKSDGIKIETTTITTEEKGASGNIPRLVRGQVNALSFRVGKKGYYQNPAILDYLEELTKYDWFRYLLFVDANGAFLGLAPARPAFDRLRNGKLDIVKVIEEGDLRALDGIVLSSVPVNGAKQEALTVMDKENLMDLPIIDQDRKFVGVVQRNKLTSSILLELLARS